MSAHLPATMNAVIIEEPGGPEVLKSGTRDVPQPGPGEVLVKVEAAGVNGPDLMQRKGLYPAPKGASDLLGLEIAGAVVALGDGVDGVAVGDTVCGLTNGGGYADYCLLAADLCLPIPDGMTAVEAATLPEAYFTIWSNIFMGAGLTAGETFLVHGGAGGLGSTSIQLGKAFGATVVATDSPAERCALCTELGADRVIDYRAEDFVEIVRDEFGGAHVILDIVGGDNIAKNFKAARHDGRIVQLAFAAGSKVDINMMPVMLKRLSYTGSTLRTRPDAYKAEIARQLRDLVWPKMAAGEIKSVVNHTLPLADAAGAHALMESAGHTGKIVLLPDHT